MKSSLNIRLITLPHIRERQKNDQKNITNDELRGAAARGHRLLRLTFNPINRTFTSHKRETEFPGENFRHKREFVTEAVFISNLHTADTLVFG